MTLDGGSLNERWDLAEPFAAWCERTVQHHNLWMALRARATVPDDLVERAAALAHRWRLLALTEDWCGDAVNILPVIARLAERAPDRLALRCLDRDRHLDVMDNHLTDGARSIPKVLALDHAGSVAASWGPRPAELQTWVYREGRTLVREERYKRVRRWYARDKGAGTLRELLDALESVADTA